MIVASAPGPIWPGRSHAGWMSRPEVGYGAGPPDCGDTAHRPAASKRSIAVDEFNLDAALSAPPLRRDPPPFSASEWFDRSSGRALFAPLRPLVDRLLALPALAQLYRELPDDGRPFWDRALDALDITYEVDGSLLDIPAAGPLVVVANHPYG